MDICVYKTIFDDVLKNVIDNVSDGLQDIRSNNMSTSAWFNALNSTQFPIEQIVWRNIRRQVLHSSRDLLKKHTVK
jgi:hypothetical protein